MDRWKTILYLTVIIAVSIVVLALAILNVTPSVSNIAQLSYAFLAHQFLPQIQIGYYTDAFYPINNKVTLSAYASVLNGTSKPQLSSLTRYIASKGTSAFPITTTTPIDGSSVLAPYSPSLSTLIYPNNPSNLASPNSTFYYVYPLYLVSYTVNCGGLTPLQEAQITTVESKMLKYFGNCNNTKFTYQAIVGISNNTQTQIDSLYSIMNPDYVVGSQNFLQPLSVYSTNGIVESTDTAINGTLLGYVSSLNSSFVITNKIGNPQAVNPIRNVLKGDVYTGQVLLSGLYCWNSKYTTLTNFLQTAKYSQYPYLYQYIFNSSTYLCLTVNSTDTILNATSNLDNSNFKLNPKILNGTLLTSFPDYIIANQVAIADTYQYITNGAATIVQEPVLGNKFWFISNFTNIFSLSKAPSYVFTEFSATQYLLSTSLPILGQEPPYTVIPINTLYSGLQVSQQALINNATTFLYAPLIKNLTYQYIFNTSKLGTPVFCTSLCDYNGSLVYQEFNYSYQFASGNFGYLELPSLNQTVYYNPEVSIIAQTHFVNDTNPTNSTYKQLCLVVNQYSCVYGLTPNQAFSSAQNYTAFVIYGEGNNATFVVNGFLLKGWAKTETYLTNLIKTNRIATISMLNQQGGTKWSVSGIVQSITPDDIIVAPQNFQINPGAYPSAMPLTYNWLDIAIFTIVVFGVAFLSYFIGTARLKPKKGE